MGDHYEDYTDADWLRIAIREVGADIVEAIQELKAPPRHFSDWTLEDLKVLAPADRVALAKTLLEGTECKVISE